jgi:hypothetical protein
VVGVWRASTEDSMSLTQRVRRNAQRQLAAEFKLSLHHHTLQADVGNWPT